MNRNKIIKIIVSVMLVMTINTLVNISDDLHMGIRHPEMYFTFVIVGLIGSITIQLYGAYKILGIVDAKLTQEKGT